ncbi:SDR family NAD(P)-dependent oxidoreductase [Nocardia arthritidis]|uniref:SDR family NAD(P)-dependent oxidoreductase n=1 Tax=Nocardia arthritidis TaxID=228602 RepID=A0A6G9YL01_9NOCA|nr:SDR family NAD(P)-dependent oxidoreductase [Nocardia arthritidis]QIS13613.1 SDR family NAD(P)-dependent oxidoreductase [Nocardia arthritidis]
MSSRGMGARAMAFLGRKIGGGQFDWYNGRIVAITGAGSGIGRELSLELSRRGAHLALADIDAAKVGETKQLCTGSGRVEISQTDVHDRDASNAFAADTIERFGRCDVLVTCAGILHVGTVASTPDADFETVMGVNFLGTVHVTKAFLPHLLATGEPARIANLSSALGFVGSAEHAPYAASKFAIRAFGESLRAELAGSNVAVSVVFPGGIRTPISRAALVAPDVDPHKVIARFERRIARTDADTAARAILAGVERGRAQVLIGADAWLATLAARIAGPHHDRVINAVAKLRSR